MSAPDRPVSLGGQPGSPLPFSAITRRDFALIRRILEEQDEKAYADLLTIYTPSVRRIVLRIIRQPEAVEDLTMEIFTRAFRYLPTFKPLFAFSTWLFRIATNYCIDFVRRRRIKTVSLHSVKKTDTANEWAFDYADDAPTPQEALIQLQRSDGLRQVVARLPPKYRCLVQLRYFEELTYEEIAVRQQLPLGTIKAQLHRGRELLRQLMANQNESI